MMRCWHRWGFPRRRDVFGEHRNVDVESCVCCGAQRLALVQFGGSELEGERPPVARVGELRLGAA